MRFNILRCFTEVDPSSATIDTEQHLSAFLHHLETFYTVRAHESYRKDALGTTSARSTHDRGRERSRGPPSRHDNRTPRSRSSRVESRDRSDSRAPRDRSASWHRSDRPPSPAPQRGAFSATRPAHSPSRDRADYGDDQRGRRSDSASRRPLSDTSFSRAPREYREDKRDRHDGGRRSRDASTDRSRDGGGRRPREASADRGRTSSRSSMSSSDKRTASASRGRAGKS